MPAPADMRPKANEAAPIRDKLGSKTSGIRKPRKLKAKPLVVAKMRGLRISSRTMPDSPCRAMGQTAPTLNMGTQKPMRTAINNKPSLPVKRSTIAKAMNELNLKPIWALAA